jgi:hypothetical protein
MLPCLDGYLSHIAWTLPNKPLQRMWSPQGHRVESLRRLGGAHTAERQGVDMERPRKSYY